MSKKIAIAATLALVIGGCGDKNTPAPDDRFTDTRDGKVYRTVKIGKQTWMAENLNYAGAGGDVGVCYENSADSCAKYGRLYGWVEAMNIDASYSDRLWNGSDVNHQGICPNGWRVPSSADWDVLVTTAGGAITAGSTLKSQVGWFAFGDISSTDEFGFSAMPGGTGRSGAFRFAGHYGLWWSATNTEDYATGATYRLMYHDTDNVLHSRQDKKFSHSVRCVRD